MRKEVDVSIIIVNWNRLDDVLKSLHYLRRQRELRKEVVVVDNASTDGSAERLSRFKWVRLIRLPTNVGPAEARNCGIRIASGRYIVFLDSDTVLPKSGLAKLVSRMDKDPTIGIIGCRIVNTHTRKTDAWIHALPESSHERREFDTYSFSAAGAIVRASPAGGGPVLGRAVHLQRGGGPFDPNVQGRISHPLLTGGARLSSRLREWPGGAGAYWRLLIRNWIWIFYRYYPAHERLKKIVTYSILYIIKGAINRRLNDCVKGILEGVRRTEIIAQFPEKLTPEEVNRLYALNRRSRLKLGR